MKRHLQIINSVLLLFAMLSIWLYPTFSPMLGMITLFTSLALSTYAIYDKHKGTENARPKILKEVGVMVLTLIVILFLGGIAAMLVNYQIEIRWGAVAGLVSAIGASFLVGYLVRVGMMRFTD